MRVVKVQDCGFPAEVRHPAGIDFDTVFLDEIVPNAIVARIRIAGFMQERENLFGRGLFSHIDRFRRGQDLRRPIEGATRELGVNQLGVFPIEVAERDDACDAHDQHRGQQNFAEGSPQETAHSPDE